MNGHFVLCAVSYIVQRYLHH